ncbi:endonuclease V [Deinococcus sp. Arct2-2]|uniref:endonuclease V n=1 Tax=Deinococcus sp. Arct2-2 TaxID=2568653 RepID=UPI0010A45960|nr:endonuclease V [Deinococcus sp. Arct2-2]THF71355.1 endonuclease V [Deinococcus sp. Arct2-2]
MILACVDVDYREDGSARTAALLFENWGDAQETEVRLHTVPQTAPYVPGAFYKRELPCLLPVLEPLAPQLAAVVIDGYVTLDAQESPGLGWHLFDALGGAVPVIGVAKTAFRGSAHAQAVQRGSAIRPLYVTAAGIDVLDAAEHLRQMAGPHRIPTLLGRVDRACREAV